VETASDSTSATPFEVLNRTVRSGRLPHSILLSGDVLPKLEASFREIAAKLLECDDAATHPDYHELRPQKRARMINIGTKADRAGGQWPPNSMRRLIADLQLSPQAGGRKIAAVFEADRMNASTANCFLKTLEEPPRDTLIFLLTTRPYDLLPTIRSRCMNLRLPRQADAITDDGWRAWIDAYEGWLRTLISDSLDRRGICHTLTHVYGLISRFEAIAERLGDQSWAEAKKRLPDGITDEAKEANEVGHRKGIIAGLLREIEEATYRTACGTASEAADAVPPVAKLARAIDVLEKSRGLLELNYQRPAALEHFFLHSLRIWSR